MKNRFPILGAAIALSITSASQAATVLSFETDVPTSGNIINVTNDPTNSGLTDRNNGISGKKAGETWGDAGLQIDGQEVLFTITRVVDFDGAVHTSDGPGMVTHGTGMGVDSGVGFMIDGEEQLSFAANKELVFESMSFREFGLSEAILQSDSWIGLTGVNSKDGFSYNSAEGSFHITKDWVGTLTAADLVGDDGPLLTIAANDSIMIDNALDATLNDNGTNNNWNQLFGIQKIEYSAAVPEPSSTMLIGLSGVAMLLRRRR